LREALKVLTAEGLVRHEPRRGCFVNEVTQQDLDDIFPVIALLEGRCAFDATQRATPADVQALEVWHQRLQQHAEAGRINDYYEANFAIHEAIIQLANNKWLAQTIDGLRKILKLARLQQLHAPGRLKQSLAEHLAIFAALKAGDAAGADTAMRNHLLQQREALLDLALAKRHVLTA
jgi:DNA-binding GntR family transcriptional regulator